MDRERKKKIEFKEGGEEEEKNKKKMKIIDDEKHFSLNYIEIEKSRDYNKRYIDRWKFHQLKSHPIRVMENICDKFNSIKYIYPIRAKKRWGKQRN